MIELIALGVLVGATLGVWLTNLVRGRKLEREMRLYPGIVPVEGERASAAVRISTTENKVSGLRVTGAKEER